MTQAGRRESDHPKAEPPSSKWLYLLPALMLAVGTLSCWIFPLDQLVAGHFYFSGDGNWVGDSIPVVRFLLQFGDYPSIVLGISALGVAVVCIGSRKHESWRRAGLYLMISLVLCHVLVNPILKKYYNRARPRETVLWGGQRPYTPVLALPRGDEKGRSFPSGHAAAGFSFAALYFAFRDRQRALALAGLALGLAHGLLNGAGRISQGAHFPSDVLWSFGVVWFTCWALYRWWYRPSLTPRE
jgi:membrane-associated PAP2 superfamily phosphatase